MQMQQQQMQVQMQEQQARTNLANSRAQADMGLGAERYSRIEENKALATERKAEAHKDDIMALFNFIKAAKELDTIDLEHLEKLVSLNNVMKQKNQEEEVEQDIIENNRPKSSNASTMLSSMAS